jgi:Spy/CpxP family protein refolding chaperone
LTFARTLPDPRRREIWEATRTERLALRPYRAELRRARAEVRGTLVAEPFDGARFKAAHERLLEAEISARKVAHQLFESVALRMTPEERQAFARWQPKAERPPWRRQAGKGHEPDDDGDSQGTAGRPAAPAVSGGDEAKK